MAVPDVFSGLVGVDTDGTVLPDVADSWDILDDGRTYVFHLRDDVRWSDGKPVTAGDYECAWRRLLRPATGASVAALLFDIRGARALHQGKDIEPDQVGIRARDDLTLVVELEEPTAYFLSLLTATILLPVPRHVVESHEEAWAEPETIVANGPFRLSTWKPGQHLLLERDPTYHGHLGCNVRQVKSSFCPAWPVSKKRVRRMVQEYDDDQVDILWLGLFPPEDIGPVQQRHPADCVATPAAATSYLEFDVSRPPFDDRCVRQALALATDRKELASGFLRGMFVAATGGLVAPAIPGHSPGIALPYDPEQACRPLAQAGYPGGRGFPTVRAVGGHAPAAAEYVSDRWGETLGVDVIWEHTDFVTFERAWSTMESFPSRLSSPAPHLWLAALFAIVPDPSLFVRALPRRAYTGWQDDRFEGLVAHARRANNRQERLELYQRADRLLIDEAVVLPQCYSGGGLLVKPWIRLLPWTPKCPHTARPVIILPH